MDAYLNYITISTICISIFYFCYCIIRKKGVRFHHLRLFLISSIVISLVLPLSTFKINTSLFSETTALKIPERKELNTAKTREYTEEVDQSNTSPQFLMPNNAEWNIYQIIKKTYFLGLLFFGAKILLHLMIISSLILASKKSQQNGIIIFENAKVKSPFTFFHYVFIPMGFLKNNENKDILTHEITHASQYHSFDSFLIELLSAVMWFNPLVWMMKKSVQLVHEYLADEGVLSTGTDKLRYQALLINHVAEERLICLSSGFNHSIIKKRMIMMTKRKFNQYSKLRILALIPVAILLFLGIACVNGQNNPNVVAAIAPVKMNVLYLGVDNPIRIAVSGYDASEITASVDNGSISGGNGEYTIRPKQIGSAIVTVSSKGKEIQRSTFRVKSIPDPLAYLADKSSGSISKNELLKQKEITTIVDRFDFDIQFKIIGFTLSSTINGFVQQEKSFSNKITNDQKKIIKKVESGAKIYIENIKCKGPDGTVRNVRPIALKITE